MTLVGVITLLSQFGGLWHAGLTQLQSALTAQIAMEFEAERIQKTVARVAEEQANALLQKSVQPQIDKARQETEQKVKSFDAFLRELREQNETKFKSMDVELTSLKERNRLMQLADQAVSLGNRKAYEELVGVAADRNNALATLAASLILQTKTFYIGGTRVADYTLKIRRFALSDQEPVGAPSTPKSHSVEDLLYALKQAEDWRDRAKSAELLGTRRVKGVPEALLVAAKGDHHLEVVRDALKAFEQITGYHSPDILSYHFAEGWWREHSEEFEGKLSNP